MNPKMSVGMEDSHRRLLDRFSEEIVRDMHTDRVVRKLMGKGVFQQEDWEEITSEKVPREQRWKCLTLLKLKGPDAFCCFLSCLDEVQPHLSRPIKEHLVTITKGAVENEEIPVSLTRQPVESDFNGEDIPVSPTLPAANNTCNKSFNKKVDEKIKNSISKPINKKVDEKLKNLEKAANFEIKEKDSYDAVKDNSLQKSKSTKSDSFSSSLGVGECELCATLPEDYPRCGNCNWEMESKESSIKSELLKSTENCNFLEKEDASCTTFHYRDEIDNLKASPFDIMDQCDSLESNNKQPLFKKAEYKMKDSSILSPYNIRPDYMSNLNDFNDREVQLLSRELNLDFGDTENFNKGKTYAVPELLQEFHSSKCPMWRLLHGLRQVKRNDIIDSLKNHFPEGFIEGPKLDPATHLSKLRYSIRLKLINELSINKPDGRDWRLLADELNFTEFIPLWEQRSSLPADEVLTCWQVKNQATVGNLYQLLTDLGMETAASIL